MSGWAKTGLYPFNPNRVLQEIQVPAAQERQTIHIVDTTLRDEPLRTPITSEHLVFICRIIERNVQTLDDHSQQCFQKFANGAEKALSARDLLSHENADLIKQNNESHVRASTKSTVVGKGIVMSFEEIRETRKKREEKEAVAVGKRGRKRKSTASVPA
jgi:hypothetical protein